MTDDNLESYFCKLEWQEDEALDEALLLDKKLGHRRRRASLEVVEAEITNFYDAAGIYEP